MSAIATRDPRAARDLGRLLAPQRIALIGSTSREGGYGSRTRRHLEAAGFAGQVLAPASADELDGEVDVAVVAVPAAVAPDVVSALDGRAGFVIVYSSGFEEAGAPPLPEFARGTTLIGPNSVGLYYAPTRTALTFAAAFDDPPASTGSGIFMVSQSGAFGARLVQLASRYGATFDGFVGTGNETHYGAADIARDLIADEERRPRVLALYLENVGDGAALDDVLGRAADSGVAVTVLLGGASESGAAAARSHTAAISPDHDVVREMCLLRGAAWARTDRELAETAIGLSVLPRARGQRVGVITGSGGAGVVSADLLAARGLVAPPLSATLRERLAALLPDFAATPNPVDITAQTIGDTAIVADTVRLMAESGEVDAVLVIGRADQADAVAAAAGDAVPAPVAVLDGAPSSVAESLRAGKAVLPGLDAAASVLRALAPVGPISPVGAARPLGVDQSAEHQRAVDAAATGDEDAATSLELVAAAGVAVAPWARAASPAEVIAIGDRLGWPVVLKGNVGAGVHKALHGGVRLDVTREGASDAAAALLASCGSVLVAAQLRGGPELMVGVRRDPILGLVVVAGLGGGHVELIGRTVTVPAVASPPWLARRLRQEVFARVRERYDSLADKLSEVADRLVGLARTGDYALVECNPLIPHGDGLVALDARVLSHD